MEKVTRRDLFKMVVPFGWAREAKRMGRLSSKPAQISFVLDLIYADLIFHPVNKGEALLRRFRMNSFSWRDLDEPSTLGQFVTNMAEEYIGVTHSTRVSKEDLIDKTVFYPNDASFVSAVKRDQPEAEVSDLWGYTNYDSGKVYFDEQKIKEEQGKINVPVGFILTDHLWHEWGHVDIAKRTPQALKDTSLVTSEGSKKFLYYRGGQIFAEGDWSDFGRFEEVWNETIVVRRITEQLGYEKAFSVAGNYLRNGVDVFLPFSKKHIPLETMYEMHATSDLEGFARLVGQKLPGSDDVMTKGLNLFRGINRANPGMIRETGVLAKL